jgi:hypothetical protein
MNDSRVDRRSFLALSLATISTTAGCSGDENDSTPSVTETQTTVPPSEQTATPTQDSTSTPTTTSTPTETQSQPVDFGSGTPIGKRIKQQRVGATHVGSKYRFEDGDLLNEGAKVLEDLGMGVFKGYLHKPALHYPFTQWPEFSSMVEVAQHDHYRELFSRDFDTFVLTTYAHTASSESGGYGYFYHEFSDEDAGQEEKSFYQLTRYLLEEYSDREVEFVFQNWEGDWSLAGGAGESGPLDSDVLERGKRWWNARQRGIKRAREEVESEAFVFGACEINRVREAMEDDVDWIVNTILDDLNVDLVSYSAWDICGVLAGKSSLDSEARNEVHQTLDYIEERAPTPSEYLTAAMGDDVRPLYIGEYGFPLVEQGMKDTMQAVRGVAEESLNWGSPYVLFWQTYDNEVKVDGERVVVDENIEETLEDAFGGFPENENVYGYYLIRPDGRRSPMWYYFANLLETNTDDSVRFELDFDNVVLESEVNSEIPEEQARHLAFACREMELSDGTNSTTFDIGIRSDELTFTKGTSWPEVNDEFSQRWLGGPDSRAIFYLHYDEFDLEAPLETLTLFGSAVENGIMTDISLDGEVVETVELGEKLQKYDISLLG